MKGSFSVATDPCLTFPDGDVSEGKTSGNNSYPNGSWEPAHDNLGNPIEKPSEWYFGRGLVQLTWGCNYLKTQVSIKKLLDSIQTQNDTISNDLAIIKTKINLGSENTAELILEKLKTVSICRNPSILCGNYKTKEGTPEITYSDSIIDQAIPWLACIIYWCENINIKSDWTKNYNYQTALQGIGPSGSADSPKRVAFSLLFAYMMGLDDSNFFTVKSEQGVCDIGLSDMKNKSCTVGGSKIYKTPSNWNSKMSCDNCSSQECTGTPSVSAPWTGKCEISSADPGGWGQADIPCGNACATCNNREKECPSKGGGGGGNSPKIPFTKSPIEIFKLIMGLKQSKNTISSCLSKLNISNLSETQKAKIGATQTAIVGAWESNNSNTHSNYLTYAINCKLPDNDKLKQYTWDVNSKVNPIYTWEGFALAAYLWNLGAKSSPDLKQYGGFCSESDSVKQLLTLAIFLGNATVESANFMVCQESILAIGEGSGNKGCNEYMKSEGFPGRYFNNCDNANPYTYSCQCASEKNPGGSPASPGTSTGQCKCDKTLGKSCSFSKGTNTNCMTFGENTTQIQCNTLSKWGCKWAGNN